MSESKPIQSAPPATEEQRTQKQSELARLLDKSISVGEGGVEIKTLEDLRRLATYIVESGLSPKGDTVAAVLVKIQAGAELGFTPMRSLGVLTSVNGRVGIMGDAAKALIQSKKALKPGTHFEEWVIGEGDARTAHVRSHRAGVDAPFEHTFSVADAKRARLIDNNLKPESPWLRYQDRMLKYRALGFQVRDHYSDILMGLYVTEELADFPTVRATERPAPPQATDPLFDAPIQTSEEG